MFNSIYKKIASMFSGKSYRMRRRNKVKRNFFIILLGVILLILLAIIIFSFNRKERSVELSIKDKRQDCLQLSNMNWCQSTQECFKTGQSVCPDELNKLIADIKRKTGVEFIYQGPTSFSWTLNPLEYKESEQIIQGFIYNSELTFNQVKQIENYLEKIGVFDPFNVADGIAGGFRGYYYQNFSCILDFRYKEMKNEDGNMVPVKDLLGVKLKCGSRIN